MDVETKHIVASNLTIAYSTGRKDMPSEQQIVDIYLRFVRLIEEARNTRTQGGSGFTPGRPI